MLTRLPSGPSGSTIAGILLLGLIARKSGAICSPLEMFTGMTLYGSSISSSATLILRPFGVFQVCSSMVISVILRESGYPVPRNLTALQLPSRNTCMGNGQEGSLSDHFISSPCSTEADISSSRPQDDWPPGRSDGQGWPQAIA